ncbi:carboxylating nicotinate-nucleotide diphosphorylase [Nocardioides sp. AN3]
MIVRTELDKLPAELRAELSAAGIDVGELYDAVETAVDEDLPEPRPGEMPAEDVTSVATIPIAARARGDFAVREPGVVSGLGVAALVFCYVMGRDVEITDRVPDGTRVQPGDVVMRVAGPTRGLLTAERTALNYASHLSGVATATAAWVDAVAGTRARILDTRKTLPTFRNLQKYAVRCGGGVNHRSTLSELALVKDNHVIAAGGVVPAFQAVRATYPGLPVEVEVTTLDELRALLAVGCDRILLDNMSSEQMREAVQISAGRATLEASGGLTVERAREVAETGVDFISVGALTHSVRVFDIGFDLESTTDA